MSESALVPMRARDYPVRADVMKSPFKIAAVLALMFTAWAAGFFTAGRPHARRDSPDSTSATASPRTRDGNARAATSGRGAEARDEKKGRVLSALLAAMQQPESPRRYRALSDAISQVGPDEIHAALDLAKQQPRNAGSQMSPGFRRSSRNTSSKNESRHFAIAPLREWRRIPRRRDPRARCLGRGIFHGRRNGCGRTGCGSQ